MIDRQIEKRIFKFVLWFMAARVVVNILASCTPYEGLAAGQPVSTETPARSTARQPRQIQITATPAPLSCTVKTGIPLGALNIRTGAGIDHSIITVLREGQQLTLTPAQSRGRWIQVRTSRNITGWINSNCCTTGE